MANNAITIGGKTKCIDKPDNISKSGVSNSFVFSIGVRYCGIGKHKNKANRVGKYRVILSVQYFLDGPKNP
ncbi:hypothetical protein [Marinomonas lutimaris]|uniref:hypothetical protein n=1 Tax=Marinomonas lutimaris TaxID=2846746 RepID=UPI001CA4B1ED|nr:hypothetical protein [Marinomonas lutimaris]